MSVLLSSFFDYGTPVISTPPISGVTVDSSSSTLPAFIGLESVLSGNLTADTYDSILNITGSGWLSFASIEAVDTTSRVMTIKITIDGVNVIEVASGTVTSTGAGTIAVGAYVITGGGMAMESLTYNTSLDISVKSSNSENAKSLIYYKYWSVS